MNAADWDAQYRDGRGLRWWPSEMLTTAIGRRYPHDEHGQGTASGTVLELGAGVGNNAWFLAEQGFTVVAVEPSTAAHNLANLYLERRRVDDRISHWRRLGRGPIVWDGVVDVTTCQHMDPVEFRETAKRILEWLKPGGWWISVRLGPGTHDYAQLFPNAPPVWALAPSELRVLLTGWGFATVRINRWIREYDEGAMWAEYLVVEAEAPSCPRGQVANA